MIAQLEDLAVQLPEALVLLRIIRGHFSQMAQGLLDNDLIDLAQEHVFLKRFARDVQGQVFGVHHALEEGQVFGD